MANSIGEAIKKLRRANGISQEKLADMIEMNRSTYAYKEKNSSFKADELAAVANVLKISYDALLRSEISHPLNIPNEPPMPEQSFEQPVPEIKSEIDENFAVLTNKERRLLKKFRELTANDKNLVENYIDSIKNTEE